MSYNAFGFSSSGYPQLQPNIIVGTDSNGNLTSSGIQLSSLSDLATLTGEVTTLNCEYTTLSTTVNNMTLSGLTAGEVIVATSSSSIAGSTVISQATDSITIGGTASTTKFKINNSSGKSVFTVDSSTPEISLYANTGLYDTMFVQPAATSSGALYVLDPSGNTVFNVATTSGGAVNVGGLDSTTKFSVSNAGAAPIINVDTSTPAISINSFTGVYDPLQVKPTTGLL